jgi:cytochrome c oxidase assembly factor CtaG
MDLRLERTIGAALLALAAGTAACIIWCFLLVSLGFWTQLIPWAILGPQPKEFGQVMMSIYGSGVVVGIIVTFVLFRRLSRRGKVAR